MSLNQKLKIIQNCVLSFFDNRLSNESTKKYRISIKMIYLHQGTEAY